MVTAGLCGRKSEAWDDNPSPLRSFVCRWQWPRQRRRNSMTRYHLPGFVSDVNGSFVPLELLNDRRSLPAGGRRVGGTKRRHTERQPGARLSGGTFRSHRGGGGGKGVPKTARLLLRMYVIRLLLVASAVSGRKGCLVSLTLLSHSIHNYRVLRSVWRNEPQA